MNRIALVRHSHTEYNVIGEKGKFCGSSDPPLTQRGKSESSCIAKALESKNYRYIISSPLRRAIETAEIISEQLSLSLKIDNRLTEIDYGLWDGLTKKEIETKFPDQWKEFKRDPIKNIPPDGEKPENVLKRVKDSISEAFVYKPCIIVSHKTSLRLFLCWISGIPLIKYRKFCNLRLASISYLVFINNEYQIKEINSVKHLTMIDQLG
ncbi:MAG: histidine phosphatase family protein [Candidatus Hodarchaeota archaeon]